MPTKTPPNIRRTTLVKVRKWGLYALLFGAAGLIPLSAVVLRMRQEKSDTAHQGSGQACATDDDCAPPAACTRHFRAVGYPQNNSTCEIGCDSKEPNTCPQPQHCVKMTSGPIPEVGDGICTDG